MVPGRHRRWYLRPERRPFLDVPRALGRGPAPRVTVLSQEAARALRHRVSDDLDRELAGEEL